MVTAPDAVVERPRFTTIMLDRLADAAFTVDDQGRVLAWNYAASRLLGWRPQVAEGSSCAALLEGITVDGIPCRAPCPRATFRLRSLPQEQLSHPNLRVRTIDGAVVEAAVVEMAVDFEGRPAILHLLRRVDEFTRDELTGLAGRRRLNETFVMLHSLAVRSGTPLTVAIIDVDRLKRINDTQGHTAGDAVLRAVSAALLGGRRHELVARWGGDEFVVLLPGTTPAEALRRFRRSLQELRERGVPGVTQPVTISGGIADAGWGDDLTAVVARADTALRSAKARRGRFALAAAATDDGPDLVGTSGTPRAAARTASR